METLKVQNVDVAYFQSILPRERVIEDIADEYSHDKMESYIHFPDVLLKVLTTQEVAQVMTYANMHRIPVVVRGGGTGLVGASVAIAGGIMLDMTGMDHFIDLDQDNLTLTIQSGVLLQDVIKYLNEESPNLLYAPDPGRKDAALGGNISTNAGGMRAVKYGVTRNYIMGLTVVLPTGKVVHFGGKAAKNSSGYDLKDLVIGAEGTLGVITEAILKLIPKPKLSFSVVVPFNSIEEASHVVPQFLQQGITPTAIEFFERRAVDLWEQYYPEKYPVTEGAAYLLMTFDGNDVQQVDQTFQQAMTICKSGGGLTPVKMATPEQEALVWRARAQFLLAIQQSAGQMEEVDICVPRADIAKVVAYSHQVEEEEKIRLPFFGHAGDGNIHIYIAKDDYTDDQWPAKLDAVLNKIYACAKTLHGEVSGEHGIGYGKKHYFMRYYGEDVLTLMRGIKDTFDPNHILNPGKVFD